VDRYTIVATNYWRPSPACDVCETFGEHSLYEAYIPGNDSELILTVKMKIRHPVVGYFGIELRAICNNCGVMAA